MADYSSITATFQVIIAWAVIINILIVVATVSGKSTKDNPITDHCSFNTVCEVCVQTKYSRKGTCVFLKNSTSGPRCTRNTGVKNIDRLNIVKDVSDCQSRNYRQETTTTAATTTTTAAPTTTPMMIMPAAATPASPLSTFFNPAGFMTPGGLITIVFMPTVVPPTARTTSETTERERPITNSKGKRRRRPTYMEHFQPPFNPNFDPEFVRSSIRGRSAVFFFGGMALTFAISAVGYIISRLNEGQRTESDTNKPTTVIVLNNSPKPKFDKPWRRTIMHYGDGI